MYSKHSKNSSKRMITRFKKPRTEKRKRVSFQNKHTTKPKNLNKIEKIKASRRTPFTGF